MAVHCGLLINAAVHLRFPIWYGGHKTKLCWVRRPRKMQSMGSWSAFGVFGYFLHRFITILIFTWAAFCVFDTTSLTIELHVIAKLAFLHQRRDRPKITSIKEHDVLSSLWREENILEELQSLQYEVKKCFLTIFFEQHTAFWVFSPQKAHNFPVFALRCTSISQSYQKLVWVVGGKYSRLQYQSYLTGPEQIALIFDCDELFR